VAEGITLNAAVTFFAAFIVTVQVVAVPVQSPDQVMVEPLAGAAVRVTDALAVRAVLVQVVPQLMPPTELVTVPVPVLVVGLVTVSVIAGAVYSYAPRSQPPVPRVLPSMSLLINPSVASALPLLAKRVAPAAVRW